MGDIIKEALSKGIDLLNKELSSSEQIINMITTFGLQLLATLILFLFVRFKFWNVVTNFLEKRKSLVTESLKERDVALSEAQQVKQDAEQLKAQSKQLAKQMVEDAKQTSIVEAGMIQAEAQASIRSEKQKAEAEIAKEKADLYAGVKKEAIDIAYIIAEQIVQKEVNRDVHHQMVADIVEHLDDSAKDSSL